MIVNFTRTKRAFHEWDSCQQTEIVRRGNKYNRDLLVREGKRFISSGLKADVDSLVEHYDAWLGKYARTKSSGGDICEPIYVGPDGFPFPTKSKQAFRGKFQALQSKLEGS